MLLKTINYGNGVKLSGILYEKSEEFKEAYSKRPAVVVCPGGAYSGLSDREADIVAAQFLAKGFNVFVFDYSLNEQAAFPNPLVELSVAIKDIRKNSESWNIYKDQISVCGFSAGGHLAASLGTLWNDPEICEKSGCFNGENKPNALILGYPVISASWMKSSGSLDRLIGKRDYKSTEYKLNLQNNVGKHTPPSFIFHTYNDNVVPVEDSLIFAGKLAEYNVPFDLHIFTNGCHGMSIANDLVSCVNNEFSKWVDMASNWLWSVFGGRDDIKPLDDFNNRAKFIK